VRRLISSDFSRERFVPDSMAVGIPVHYPSVPFCASEALFGRLTVVLGTRREAQRKLCRTILYLQLESGTVRTRPAARSARASLIYPEYPAQGLPLPSLQSAAAVWAVLCGRLPPFSGPLVDALPPLMDDDQTGWISL
jgi:hypothetical protein